MGRKALSPEDAISRINAAQPTATFLRFEGEGPLSRQMAVRSCGVCHHEWPALVANILKLGSGCPVCAKRENARARAFAKIDPRVAGFVYRIDSACGLYSKVGFTQNLRKRLTDMEGRVPFKLGGRIKVLFKGNARVACELEHRLKLGAKSARFSGFDGASEWLLAESLDKIVLDEYLVEVYNRAPARYLI